MVKQLLRHIILALYLLIPDQQVLGQCPAGFELRKRLVTIEKDTTSPAADKLKLVTQLYGSYLACHQNKDSIYARIVHRLGAMYSLAKDIEKADIEKAINFTREAIAINASGNPGTDNSYRANSYYNLGNFYSRLYLYEDAHRSWDNCISIGRKFPAKYNITLLASEQKARAYYQTSDYQKVKETADDGILLAKKIRNAPALAALLAQKAQAQGALNELREAEENIREAIRLQANAGTQDDDLATCYSIYAQILSRKGTLLPSIQYYRKALALHTKEEQWVECSQDLLDMGYVYDYYLRNTKKALACYNQGLRMLEKGNDDYQRVGIYINIGFSYWRQKQFSQALRACQQALNALPVNFTDTTITSNPTEEMLKLAVNDYYVSTLLSNKAEVFLDLYKKHKNKQHLASALKTYQLADKVLDMMRRKQYGEQSKLFWRGNVKHIYKKAIEACYLAGDTKLAFFFMEKSRAVLLNDKLNELGAYSKLPPVVLAKDRQYRMKVYNAQQKWASYPPQTPESEKYLARLLQAKNDFENFIKALEKKYPEYYRNKYAENAPTLPELQAYLALNQASFVHYFQNDSVTFMLSITPRKAHLIRLEHGNFMPEQLSRFIAFCSDKQLLNRHYSSFASLANNLFKSLFQPLQLPAGRIIICADNFLIPFEALCKDSLGEQFLIQDHVFSYVYSAGYLLKEFTAIPAKGNFIGFAPVHFQPHLKLTTLRRAGILLREAADHFHKPRVFTHQRATKNNFIRQMAGYSIVNVFSHARADTAGGEPVLYMQDSAILLSDLQLPHQVATRLVILSACQTNVGKNATGEGIISLARGFASAGIPAVAATLWKADEQAIFEISGLFHAYLAQGMPKDDALRQAKLNYLKRNRHRKSLPYFWANMIIMGNGSPVEFIKSPSIWWWIGPGLILLAVFVLHLARKK